MPLRNIPNDELEVPPNTVVRTDGYFRLPRNARIDAFQPHMHMRGSGMTLEAINLATTRPRFSARSITSISTGTSTTSTRTMAAPLLPAGTVLHMIGDSRQHGGESPQS